jgi:transcription initiation factor TFIIF subunit beta
MVAKQYDMTIGPPQGPKNTFIFSEKDLEGYKPRQPGRNMVASNQDPLKGVDTKNGGPVKVEKPKSRFRTIPKKTAVLGSISREFTCYPRENEEFRRIQAKKEQIEKDKSTALKLMSGEAANNLHTEAMNLNGSVDVFIKTAAEKKKRAQDNKATRMDRAPLMDMLLELFKAYRFYPMSTLKARTKQPEAWLKEVLSSIATLVKSGPAANTYTLNETMSELHSALKADDKNNGEVKDEVLASVKTEEVAPVHKEAEDEDEIMEDDDDEGDFEDA